MARKNINRALSGGVIAAFVVVLCTLNAGVLASITGEYVYYNISGSIGGIEGVELKGLVGQDGKTAVTDASGNYSAKVRFDFSGTVTPTKAGYTFQPANRPYKDLEGDQAGQDYTPTEITCNVSGTITFGTTGMEGVELTGLTGNPITGPDGTYNVKVKFGFSGDVIPKKEGYKFTPEKFTYSSINKDQLNQNFKVERLTFEISGNAGAEGVALKGFPKDVVSGSGGKYTTTVEYGWIGKVTPQKEGHTFLPAEIPYNNVNSVLMNQDYTATKKQFTISGSVGQSGVEMKGLGVFSDQNGSYTATVDYGFTGTVTPTMTGYKFSPGSSMYTKLTDNKTQDYTPEIENYTVTVTTSGLDGVVLSGLPNNPVTAGGGTFSVKVPFNTNVTIAPAKDGYDFEPASKDITAITKNEKVEFKAIKKTFTISGNAGIAAVALRGFPGNVVSDASGNYTATVDWNWSGSVTPQVDGYTFEPANRPYTSVIASETSQNFEPTRKKYTISGTITSDKNQPVEGVNITISTNIGAAPVTTGADGKYELRVDHGWEGTVTPQKEGYTFKQPPQIYKNINADKPNQNYIGTVKTFKIMGTVKIGGVTPVAGATINTTNGGGTATTDSQGKFSVDVPYGWSGDLTPVKRGMIFAPQTFTNVLTDMLDGQPVAPTEIGPKPIDTTVKPGETTVKPGETTVKPGETTVKPGETTVKPGETTVKPVDPNKTVVKPPTTNKSELEKQMDEIKKMLAEIGRGGTGVPGTTGKAGGPLITNSWTDGDIINVLHDLSAQAKIPINYDDSVTGVVTGSFENQPLDKVLEMILAGTPYSVHKEPDYYLVYSIRSDVENTKLFAQVSKTRRFKLNNATARRAVETLSEKYRGYVNADTSENSRLVLITAPDYLVDRIVADLKEVDKTLAAVLLDAKIVVLERGDLLNMGVEWGWPTVEAGVFANNSRNEGTNYGSGIQMGYTPGASFTNALTMTLNLLEQNDEAKILSSPQVVAMDANPATITVTKEEWFMMQAQQNSSYYNMAQLQNITSGTTLNIVPYIGDDNDITLDMAVEVSDSIPKARGSDLPVVTRRRAQNRIRVQDGGTAIVAGLTENRSTNNYKGVPGLSKLPLIGKLFKNNGNDSSTREMAVFVTARIVPSEGMGIEYTGPNTKSTIQTNKNGNSTTSTKPARSTNSTSSVNRTQPEPQVPADSSSADFHRSLLDSLSNKNGR